MAAAGEGLGQCTGQAAVINPATLKHKKGACGAGRGEAQALEWLPPENDFGNVEYKLRLKQPLPGLRFQQLVTQLNYRLSEGAGECFYCVGAALSGCKL